LGDVLAFVLDLGISVSLNFASMQGVCKTQRKTAFFGCVADVFDAMSNYVCEVFFWCCGGI